MKTIIEFLRGPRDGEVLETGPTDAPLCEADGVVLAVRGEGVGARFWCPTDYSLGVLQSHSPATLDAVIAMGCRFPGHVYRVVAREHTGVETRFRLLHLGPED